MNGSQEREAIRKWLKDAGAGDAINMDDLPTLEIGHAHAWSPRWLKISQVIHFAKRITLDTSGTPDQELARVAVQPLSQADIGKLSTALAESIERAAAEDPTKLQAAITERNRKITQLETQLAALQQAPPAIDDQAIQAARDAARNDERRECMRLLQEARNEIPDIVNALISALEQPLIGAAAKIDGVLAVSAESMKPATPQPRPPAFTGHQPPRIDSHKPATSPAPAAPPAEGLSEPEQRILDAIAWANSAGIANPSNEVVAFAAKYSPTSTSYTNPRGKLRAKGLVEFPVSGKLNLTPEGRKIANFPNAIVDYRELQQRIFERLSEPQTRILRPLLTVYPEWLTNADCAAAASYSPTSTSYTNPRGELNTLGLIEMPKGGGKLRAAPLLFLEAQ
jgi:hypothetical protein